MLVLLISLGETQYAIDCKQIVEVISLVRLQNIAQMPEYVAGLLNYRGQIIPVIDLCQLLVNNQYEQKLNTRIIIVKFNQQETVYLLGLIAEQVTETLTIEENDLNHAQLLADRSFIDAQYGMIPLLILDSVLSELQLKLLPNSYSENL